MGLVKARRRLAEDGSPHRAMQKQQRAKAGTASLLYSKSSLEACGGMGYNTRCLAP